MGGDGQAQDFIYPQLFSPVGNFINHESPIILVTFSN